MWKRVLAGCILSSSAAAAQAPSPPPEATITVRKDTQPATITETFRDTALTRDDIAREVPLSLADSLRHAPSASVQQTSPSQVTIYVRGVSGRELAHMVDGVRLNSTIFRAGNNPFIGLVDVYSLERVDIRPGANSVRYGADAIGGAVLMWTPVPGFSVPVPLLSVSLLQTAASNPLGGASRAEATYSARAWALRLGATRMAAAAIMPGGGERSPVPASYIGARREPGLPIQPELSTEQIGTELTQLGADGTLRVKLPARLSLIARAQHSVVPSLIRYDQLTPRFKSDLPDRAESSLTPLERSMVSLEVSGNGRPHEEPANSVQLSWQRLAERARFRGFTELCSDPTGIEMCPGALTLLRDSERSIEENRADAFGLAGRTRFALGRLSTTIGASLQHEIVSSKAFSEVVGEAERTPSSSRFPDGSSATEAGVYAIPSVALADSLTLSVSGRASLFHLAIAAREGENGTPESQLTLADWSSQVLVEWRAVPGFTVGAGWGRALRPPNVQDLATQGTRARGRYQVPNDSLSAEHAQSADVGVKFRTRTAAVQATVFHQRNTDAIVLAPTRVNGETETAEGDAYYSSLNASSVKIYGLEANGQLVLHRLFAPFVRWLAMKGDQFNPPGLGLPATTPSDRVPPLQGESGFRSQLSETVAVEFMTAFRLKQDRLNDPINVDDNRIPVGGTPGFVTYNARLDWRAGGWLHGRLNFDNITNQLVLEHGSGFYRPGFAVSASLQLELERLGTPRSVAEGP